MNDSEPIDFDMQLLLAEAGWVRGLARRLAREQSTADDLAQWTLTLALEKRPSPAGGLRPWLARVLARLSHHRTRSEARRAARELRSATGKPTSSPPAEELLIQLETQQLIAAAVCKLPEPYRSVLLRHYYAGQSVKAIARATNRTPSTVRSQLSRGVSRLRSALHQDPAASALRRTHAFGALGLYQVASGPPGWRAAFLTGWSGSHAAAGVAAAVSVTAVTLWAFEPPSVSASRRGGTSETALATTSGAPASQDGAESTQGRREVVRATAEAPRDKTRPTVRALLVDNDGNPVPGAVLRVHRTPPRRGGAATEAVADARGEVRLEIPDALLTPDPDEGPLAFAASAPGYATFHRDHRIALEGETNLQEMTLFRGGALEGRVVDDAGEPVPGAVVLLAAADEDELGELRRLTGPPAHHMRTSAITNATGRFVCASLPLGPARLWIQGGDSLWSLTKAIDVVAGKRRALPEVRLQRAPAQQRIRGRVATAAGLPSPGAIVTIANVSQGSMRSVQASSKGEFICVPGTDGPVLLIARSKGTLSPVVASRGGKRVELRLGAARTVSIRLVAEGGDPLADAWVRPKVLNDEFGGAFGNETLRAPGQGWVRTDARGRATVTATNARFVLAVLRHGFRQLEAGPYRRDRLSGPVLLEMRPIAPAGHHRSGPRSPARKEAPRPAAAPANVFLRGEFAVDGKPASGWYVELRTCGRERKPITGTARRTDPAGAFDLSCPIGHHEIVLRGTLQGGERIEVYREVRLTKRIEEWRGSLRTGILAVAIDGTPAELRAVRGDPGRGHHEVTSLGAPRGRTVRARVPVGETVLQGSKVDRRTDWSFLRHVRVRER